MSKFHSTPERDWYQLLSNTIDKVVKETKMPRENAFTLCDKMLEALCRYDSVLVVQTNALLNHNIQNAEDVKLWLVKNLTEIIQEIVDGDDPRVFIVEPGIDS